jgi:alanine dehydrogenase
MLSLTEEFIQQELSFKTVIELVEQAFVADSQGRAVTFPAIVEYVGSANAHFGLKSGYLRLPAGNEEILGLKVGGYWMGNQQRFGLPCHRATILLIDPLNGEPLAVMPANTITRLRTAAAGAVAARHLARRDAHDVTIIGTGEQAHAQLEALRITNHISRVQVWGRRPHAVADYVAAWRDSGIKVTAANDLAAQLLRTDIVITTTPATSPVILNQWIRPGTHINAVGSDGAGKKELDPELVRRAKVVADKSQQSFAIGELQQIAPRADGRELIYAELGEICSGSKPGRVAPDEITIFDSSGVSFQDLVVANYLVKRAIAKNQASTA